ncbi:hypothetical protein B0H14DRAFT_3888524 [Mycena olivaceomarginata]|nr:hypothetical protein B0H14DRAFT_3888524 [Mycena olivaceomarginata]
MDSWVTMLPTYCDLFLKDITPATAAVYHSILLNDMRPNRLNVCPLSASLPGCSLRCIANPRPYLYAPIAGLAMDASLRGSPLATAPISPPPPRRALSSPTYLSQARASRTLKRSRLPFRYRGVSRSKTGFASIFLYWAAPRLGILILISSPCLPEDKRRHDSPTAEEMGSMHPCMDVTGVYPEKHARRDADDVHDALHESAVLHLSTEITAPGQRCSRAPPAADPHTTPPHPRLAMHQCRAPSPLFRPSRPIYLGSSGGLYIHGLAGSVRPGQATRVALLFRMQQRLPRRGTRRPASISFGSAHYSPPPLLAEVGCGIEPAPNKHLPVPAPVPVGPAASRPVPVLGAHSCAASRTSPTASSSPPAPPWAFAPPAGVGIRAHPPRWRLPRPQLQDLRTNEGDGNHPRGDMSWVGFRRACAAPLTSTPGSSTSRVRRVRAAAPPLAPPPPPACRTSSFPFCTAPASSRPASDSSSFSTPPPPAPGAGPPPVCACQRLRPSAARGLQVQMHRRRGRGRRERGDGDEVGSEAESENDEEDDGDKAGEWGRVQSQDEEGRESAPGGEMGGGERARMGRHGANGEGGRGCARNEEEEPTGTRSKSIPSSPLQLWPSIRECSCCGTHFLDFPWPTCAGWDDAHVAMGAYSSQVGYISAGAPDQMHCVQRPRLLMRNPVRSRLRIQNHCRLKTVYLRCSRNVRPQF